MKSFETPKGTVLPLLNLKGKDYLQVQHRLVWFREECPEHGIETEFLQLSETVAIAKATIRDANDRILAQGTKSETPGGFADYIEKAESGAIGRALAMCGFGTQFTTDLDEGERIVDASVQRPSLAAVPSDPGAYVIQIGQKYNGKRLDQIGAHDAEGYARWLRSEAEKKGKTLTGLWLEAVNAIEAFCKSREFPREAK